MRLHAFAALFIFLPMVTSAQWVPLNSTTTANINKIVFPDYYGGDFVTGSNGTSGSVYQCTGFGTYWQSSNNTVNPLFGLRFRDHYYGFAVGPYTIWGTSNSGSSWNLALSNSNFLFYDVCFQDPYTIYAVGKELAGGHTAMVRSTNEGTIWNTVFTFSPDTSRLLYMCFPDAINGYCCGEQGMMLKVIEGITSWTQKSTGTTQNLNCMYFFNSVTGFAAGNNSTLIKTTNSGNAWFTVQTGISGSDFKSVAFANANTGYITGTGGLIAKTTNGGLNWFTQNSGTSNNLNSISIVGTDTVFAAGNNGTLIATFNGGLIGIGDPGNNIPLATALYQNYPNPFNPSTIINFDIHKASDVKIVLYDVLGKQVEVLLNGYRNTGKYEIRFDASKYTAGVYFYSLTAGDYHNVKKMILIK